MTTFNYTNILTQAVDELSESQSYKGLFHQHKDGDPLPSAKSLYKIVELARAIIFPGYFGNSTITNASYFSASSQILSNGATLPSIENTPSVAIIR